jgi:peptide/nickel transport system substrate-binding protein
MARMTRRAAISMAAASLAGKANAAEPRRLIGVIEEDPPFFNSSRSSVISSFVAASPVYSALTRMDAAGNISGDLATAWEIAPDGMTYIFHLRSGVLWHDGKPFTAGDAKWSLENINSKLHPYRGGLVAIGAFEAPDDFTLVLRMKHPQASMISTLGNFAGNILPRHLWEGTDPLTNPCNKKPIGTGPFKFAEYVPGDHILYRKNEHYFLPGKPVFDELMFRIMPDPTSRVSAFEDGELDMIYASALPATAVERLRRRPDVDLKFSKIQASAYQAYINMRNAPYSDRRVRQALAHAIDRGFIRQSVFPGLAENMIGPVWASSPLCNHDLKDYALDPARAEALLDDAGFKRGADGTRFSLRFVYGAGDLPSSKIGDIMGRNLAAVGIKVIPRPLDQASVLRVAYGENQFDMVAGSFSLGPDPDVGVERFYNSKNISNVLAVNNSDYVNPEVDALFDEQRVQVDFTKRKALYDRIQEIIWNDIPVFPFCQYSLPGAVRKTAATGVFNNDSSNRDDFAFAVPG